MLVGGASQQRAYSAVLRSHLRVSRVFVIGRALCKCQGLLSREKRMLSVSPPEKQRACFGSCVMKKDCVSSCSLSSVCKASWPSSHQPMYELSAAGHRCTQHVHWVAACGASNRQAGGCLLDEYCYSASISRSTVISHQLLRYWPNGQTTSPSPWTAGCCGASLRFNRPWCHDVPVL